jgi:protein-disulfide isomerase
MPVAPAPSRSSEEDQPPPRNQRLLIVLGVLGVLSAVIAAMVIFSSGASTAPPKDPVARVRAADGSVTVGSVDAPMKVVVYEDFGSPASRTFDIASRDFLRLEAAEDDVLVEYRPVALLADDYTRGALAAWRTVLGAGKPGEALVFHDLLLDNQDSGSHDFVAVAKKAGVRNSEVLEAVAAPGQASSRPAGVRTTPTVLVDDRPVTAASPNELADAVQRMVLRGLH